MKTKPNDGGPAFPTEKIVYDAGHPTREIGRVPINGMSLRAYLAGMERLTEWDHPEAIIPNELSEALAGEPTPTGGWAKSPLQMFHFTAKWRAALKLIRADALIAELEKEAK